MNIFNGLSNEEINKINKEIKIIKHEYLRGQIILEDDSLCSSIGIIKRGRVSAIKHYTNGSKTTIRTLSQGECIGIALIFSANPFYKATFYADTLTTIEFITKEDILRLMVSYPKLQQNILQEISDHSIRLNEKIKLLSYKTIRQRLAYFLYTEYQKTKVQSFYIPYTKTELAGLLNVERPSMSFELSKLISDGIIANKDKLYTILKLDELLNLL